MVAKLGRSYLQYPVSNCFRKPPNVALSQEPKEYASEAAIHFWREKQAQSTTERNTAWVEQTPQPDDSVPGTIPTTPEQGPISQTHLEESPLFVPLDPVPQGSQDIDQPPLSGVASQTSSQSLADIRFPTDSRFRSVFDSYPRAPIPLEYRLPGEFEELPNSAPQRAERFEEISTLGPEIPNSAEGVFEDFGASRRRQDTIEQPNPETEIPETPSIPLRLLHSQTSNASFPLEQIGTQHATNSVDVPLSSLPSQPSLSRRHHLTEHSCSTVHIDSSRTQVDSIPRNSDSVPESAIANIPQASASQLLPASVTFSVNPTGTSSSASSRIFPVNGLSASDILAAPQSTTGPVEFGSTSGATDIRPLPINVQATSGDMDHQSQQNEQGSVARTMEKYSHMEGSTPREKMKNVFAKLRDKSTIDALRNEASATPSSFGDIEASEPPPVPETVAPLSVRVDKDASNAELTKDSAPETAAELEPTHVSETIQTVQPSELSIFHNEEKPSGSLPLGPSEFAVPLPMDSRVKDDYLEALPKSHDILRRWNAPQSQDSEVKSLFQLISVS